MYTFVSCSGKHPWYIPGSIPVQCNWMSLVRFCGMYMYLYVKIWYMYAVNVLVRPVHAPFLYICISIALSKQAVHVWIVSLQANVSVVISKMYGNVTQSLLSPVHVLVRSHFVSLTCTCTCPSISRHVIVYLRRYCPSEASCTCLNRVVTSTFVCCDQ